MSRARHVANAPGRDDRADGGDGGFTLVEALVAFIIVAIVLTMGIKVLTNGAAAARRSPAAADRWEEAASLIDGALADTQLRPGTRVGRFADGEGWLMRIDDVTAGVVPKSSAALLRIALYPAGAVGAKPMLATLTVVRHP